MDALHTVRNFFEVVYPHRVKVRDYLSPAVENAKLLHDGDVLIAHLWSEGFKIVPVTMDDLNVKEKV